MSDNVTCLLNNTLQCLLYPRVDYNMSGYYLLGKDEALADGIYQVKMEKEMWL